MSEAGSESDEPDARARTILIAGTASHVGKSTVAAGLCRVLADRGVAVSPYKAQNMSNNARVVVRPGWGDGDESGRDGSDAECEDGRVSPSEKASDQWGEIGVSQFVQARAARITPTTDTNPVLLKPRGGGESQLVLQGRARGHLAAGEYYDEHWGRALEAARESHARLASAYDVVIAEGAGSIAEINLHDRDLANIETARFADAEILLLVDIERGGAFASLYGTLELLPEDVRERVVGSVITKFRGDASILEPGIDEIESLTGVPVLGVLPYDDPGLPEEDSVSLPATGERAIEGDDDGVPDSQCVTIAVPRLPRISNATDLEALAEVPGVRVAYVPVVGETRGDAGSTERAAREALQSADAVVIPGTKNTVDDLLALREAGFDDALTAFDGPVVGLCGGYQMLGERLTNTTLEGTDDTRETVDGLGLLPVETEFEETKHLERTTVSVEGVGVLEGASGTATGYEIHAGRTAVLEGAAVSRPLGANSAASGDVLGTYLHGVFDNRPVREAFLETVFARAGLERPSESSAEEGERPNASVNDETLGSPYDRAAHLLEEFVDLDALGDPFTRPSLGRE